MTRAARLATTAAVAAALFAGALPAAATAQPGVASAGWAGFVKAGTSTAIPDVGQCSISGPTSVTSGLVTGSGVRFGGATSTCTTTVVDPDFDLTTTTSTATGTSFELSALVSLGGPRVKLTSYTTTCQADQGGTRASWSFSGLSGISGLPSPVPANYAKNLTAGTTVLATATFNEVLLPTPNDGSIELNMLHVRFLPASGITGEVVVGATSCRPTP
ncbi:hypothetical protein [Actinokineospora bangkokensis]|uniref:Peptidase n=1 Tax=Actinokineospora bangkokensis TaxID=1193682 RepID=A0A1Q9LIA2_9PSEU|nr:hypothetical protein [Actinokineospora bangkokensis]OLR91771.1 hypothetical protein BJP25_24915 [Actinokineospora bangkokensis]